MVVLRVGKKCYYACENDFNCLHDNFAKTRVGRFSRSCAAATYQRSNDLPFPGACRIFKDADQHCIYRSAAEAFLAIFFSILGQPGLQNNARDLLVQKAPSQEC